MTNIQYRNALTEVVKTWNEGPLIDEWAFANFWESIKLIAPEYAFGLIGETIDVMLEQSNESTAGQVLLTVLSLASRSDTTQIPVNFLPRKEAMINQFIKFNEYHKGKLNELFLFYRLESHSFN